MFTVISVQFESVSSLVLNRSGYVVCVIEVIDVGKGKILPGRGDVLFKVKYHGLFFRPMLNEVADAEVSSIGDVSSKTCKTSLH